MIYLLKYILWGILTCLLIQSKGHTVCDLNIFTTDNQVESVAVAGTFNHWNGDRNYMIPMEDSRGWEIELPITKGDTFIK